jgi:hypothetical protein
VIVCGTSPPARTSDLPRGRGSIRRYWRRLSLRHASMKDSPIAIAGVPGDFISQDDQGLFAFVNALRLSVREKVAAEQRRGVSLSEIVVEVREMARRAGEEAEDPKPFSPQAFRAISRQAVAWCIEAYHPAVLVEEQDLSSGSARHSLPAVLPPTGAPVNRFPAQSPNNRGSP